mgnify:CR=1 FL=1
MRKSKWGRDVGTVIIQEAFPSFSVSSIARSPASSVSSACRQNRFVAVQGKSKITLKAMTIGIAVSGIPSCVISIVMHTANPPGTGGAAIANTNDMINRFTSIIAVIGTRKVSAIHIPMLKNTTAAAGMNTDCPSGRPKLTIFLSMPSFSSQVPMFVANAAEEDAVVSAMIKVGSSFFTNRAGEIR